MADTGFPTHEGYALPCLIRACLQLSKIMAEAKWIPARKFRASLS